MKILPTGIAVIETDELAAKWIEQLGRIDYDNSVNGLCQLLKEGDTAMDIGAMIGAYSAPFKKAVGETGVVHAFDPNPLCFECLKHNCPTVQCHQMALGRANVILFLTHDTKNPGASFIGSPEGVPVKVKRLDSIASQLQGLDKLKVVKIDVEGMEPQVIEGASETLKRYMPTILIEINHGALKRNNYAAESIVAPLTALGYNPRFLDEQHSFDAERWPQLDVLFVP